MKRFGGVLFAVMFIVGAFGVQPRGFAEGCLFSNIVFPEQRGSVALNNAAAEDAFISADSKTEAITVEYLEVSGGTGCIIHLGL